MEIKSGDIDEDKQKEFALFSNTSEGEDNAVYVGNFENGNLDIKKYTVMNDKEILDGQLVNGSPVISVDEEIDPEKNQWGVYGFDNDELQPFKHNNFDIKELIYSLERREEKSPSYIFNILYDDINQDGEDDFLMEYEVKGGGDYPFRETAWSTDGKYKTVWDRNPVGAVGDDISIGVVAPWRSTHKGIIMTDENTLSRVPLETKKMQGEDGFSFWPIGRWYNSNITANDAMLLPYRKMLPEEAREAEGSMEWLDYWKEKYGTVLPILISTEDGRLLMDGDKAFGSPTFPTFMDSEGFSEYLKNAKIMEVG
ncbi:hypothetical protein KGY79_13720 [Candidatus Bipolaricaulota bacterium]|nr:hypothetical protein [Candidatus Bipolaricaulota bacterium]